jgi:hypothetical protein
VSACAAARAAISTAATVAHANRIERMVFLRKLLTAAEQCRYDRNHARVVSWAGNLFVNVELQ